jgi:hypothetical protein
MIENNIHYFKAYEVINGEIFIINVSYQIVESDTGTLFNMITLNAHPVDENGIVGESIAPNGGIITNQDMGMCAYELLVKYELILKIPNKTLE